MTIVEDTLVQDWACWRAERERALRAPHGWLSLTALHWLTAQPAHYPPVPGRWSATEHGVAVTADRADGLRLSGRPVDTAEVYPVEGAPGVEVTYADKVVEVIRRSGRAAIRLRDPQSPARAGFTGVPVYPVDRRWVVPARFDAYPEPRTVTGDGIVPGLVHRHKAMGVLRFAVAGVEYALLAYDGGPGRLSVLFRDATSGITTPGNRTLSVTLPEDPAELVLDFNRAVNMLHAFNDYGTCPLPPAENVLRLAVEAGERTPHPAQ